MKVILSAELKGRGGEGDVIEVARGFAVNYLLPNKLAIKATPGNLKQLEQRKHNIKTREDSRVEGANDLFAKLDGKSVSVAMKVGDEGRLFGSVTSPLVADAIASQIGIEVDRRRIETHGHIKELGAHDVEIAIYREVKAILTVNVVADGDKIDSGLTAVEAIEADDAQIAEEISAEVVDETDVIEVEAEVEA